MARSSSGFVAGLTAAALAVGRLPRLPGVGERARTTCAEAPRGAAAPAASKAPRAKNGPGARCRPAPAAGERVVYSLGDDRVWLVGADDKVEPHVQGHPGHGRPGAGHATRSPPAPAPSPARTASRSSTSCASPAWTAWRSASARRWTARRRSPTRRSSTGGIRESRADGDAMWDVRDDRREGRRGPLGAWSAASAGVGAGRYASGRPPRARRPRRRPSGVGQRAAAWRRRRRPRTPPAGRASDTPATRATGCARPARVLGADMDASWGSGAGVVR